jgi:hypothetical protein
MRRTLCTYAVGKPKFRIMAIAMMNSARQHADCTIDRYVVFTDKLNWKGVPSWIELVELAEPVSTDRDSNWSIKPRLLKHPSVCDDLLLYIDADSTVYRGIFEKTFDWINQHSVLVFLHFTPEEENWGKVNLFNVYRQAGYDARNLTINAGILGRKPDAIGSEFERLYEHWMNEGFLKPFFSDPMYKKNDEPYAGLAYQYAYRNLGLPVPEKAHPFITEDYMLTIGADVKCFSKRPGPVIRVPWCGYDVVRPAIVHWISTTQHLFYRRFLWSSLRQTGLLHHYFMTQLSDDLVTLKLRLMRKTRQMLSR